MSKVDLVKHHIVVENNLNMDEMLATLIRENPIRDEIAGNRYEGVQAVAKRYADLWTAFPDFYVTPSKFHETEDSVVMEAVLRGTHRGVFNGLQPTNKSFELRLVNVFRFDGDHISSETIYWDYASQLKQLGLWAPFAQLFPVPA